MIAHLRVGVLIILAIWLLAADASAATPQLGATVVLDKLVYSPSDSFVAKVKVSNAFGQALTATSTALTIYAKMPAFAPLEPINTDSEPIVQRTWYGDIGQGVSENEVSRPLSELSMDEGVYPVRVTVNSAEGHSAEAVSYITVLNPDRRKLPVVLVLGTNAPQRQRPDGVFLDDGLAAEIAESPQKGTLAQVVDSLKEHPNVKATVALSPQTLTALQTMSRAYSVVDGKGGKRAGGSSDVARAKEYVKDMQTLLAGANVGTMFYPYGQASVAQLQQAGLAADITDQVRYGNQTVARFVGKEEALGLLTPDLFLGPDSLSRLGGGVKTTVLKSDLWAAETSATPEPVELGTGKNKVRALGADGELSTMISQAPSEELANRLTAGLALRSLYGREESPPAVVLVAQKDQSLVGADSIRATIDTIAQLPWVVTTTAGEAAAGAYQPAALDAARVTPAPFSRSYARRLRKLSGDSDNLRGNVPPGTEEVDMLRRMQLVAEGLQFLGEGSETADSTGESYISRVRSGIEQIYTSVKVDPDQKVAFSSAEGKIPVAIRNNNSFPISATLLLKGKGFFEYDDKPRKVTLNPKDNLLIVKVSASYIGTNTLTAVLRSGRQDLGSSSIEVTVSSYARYILAVASFGVALFMLVLFTSRRRRRE